METVLCGLENEYKIKQKLCNWKLKMFPAKLNNLSMPFTNGT
jgi:hypothetical protein